MPEDRKRLLVLFGNQLFRDEVIEALNPDAIFMAESEAMCRRYKAHRHKLVLILSAMRSKADALLQAGHPVFYHMLGQHGDASFSAMLSHHLRSHSYDEVAHFETESPRMEASLEALCKEHGLVRVPMQSPAFVTPPSTLAGFFADRKRLFMADFYRWQRRRMKVLLDGKGKPIGGRWSFDAQNRKKLPRDLVPPRLPEPTWTAHTKALVPRVNALFADHPGDAREFWLPTTQAEAEAALTSFLEERFALFGDYEDALSSEHATLFHSVLSPLMNIGLLTPEYVVQRALEYAERANVPLNSVEGFIRQILGWREFVRAMWRTLPASHWEQNFWDHRRRLRRCWYDGTTGIAPLDDAIRRAVSTGYNHHIERLMVIGNAMLLCRIEPRDAYRWFMEMYVDSADWVMAPNLYGMALFSEGGAFTTKPYICGSSYLRKMSDYPKGAWCDVADGLYWSFVDAHRGFFAQNPRTKMLLGTLDRMAPKRKERIFALAEEHIEKTTA